MTTEEEEQILARAYAAAAELEQEAPWGDRFVRSPNGWYWGDHGWVIPPEGDPAHLTPAEWMDWWQARLTEERVRENFLRTLLARANRP